MKILAKENGDTLSDPSFSCELVHDLPCDICRIDDKYLLYPAGTISPHLWYVWDNEERLFVFDKGFTTPESAYNKAKEYRIDELLQQRIMVNEELALLECKL